MFYIVEYRNVDVGSGWSYDRAIWVDMNRDGLKDCLTARYRDGGITLMLIYMN